jgi:hypothetical protein
MYSWVNNVTCSAHLPCQTVVRWNKRTRVGNIEAKRVGLKNGVLNVLNESRNNVLCFPWAFHLVGHFADARDRVERSIPPRIDSQGNATYLPGSIDLGRGPEAEAPSRPQRKEASRKKKGMDWIVVFCVVLWKVKECPRAEWLRKRLYCIYT